MQTVDFNYFPLQPGDVVLDLGCGEGRHVISAYIEEAVTSIGVDLAHKDLVTTRDKFEPFDENSPDKSFGLSAANALNLPFADNTFDKVICSEVLEHIPDYVAVLREIRRVLKPKGLLCVSVPREMPERLCWKLSSAYYEVEGGHLRIFNRKKFRAQIEKLGFGFYKKHWAHALHTPYWWIKCFFMGHQPPHDAAAQETHFIENQYHRLLVWDLMEKPWLTQTLERLLNPVMGKSVVMYFRNKG